MLPLLVKFFKHVLPLLELCGWIQDALLQIDKLVDVDALYVTEEAQKAKQDQSNAYNDAPSRKFWLHGQVSVNGLVKFEEVVANQCMAFKRQQPDVQRVWTVHVAVDERAVDAYGVGVQPAALVVQQQSKVGVL